jgi:hypothetical protein
MKYLGDFGVGIAGKSVTHDDYVAMEDGEQYSITLSNRSGKRCDAKIKLDGEEIGVLRLDGYETQTIERKLDGDDGRFTFGSVRGTAGKKLGAKSGKFSNGLIEVEFIPEKESVRRFKVQPYTLREINDIYDYQYPRWQTSNYSARGNQTLCSCSAPAATSKGLNEGFTYLTGASDQNFTKVASIVRDQANAVTIRIRLGVKKSDDIRPLTSRRLSNSAPAPLWD